MVGWLGIDEFLIQGGLSVCCGIDQGRGINVRQPNTILDTVRPAGMTGWMEDEL